MTNNPLCHDKFDYRQLEYTKYANKADQFNIATGFVSNESIVELSHLVHYRIKLKNRIKLNLLVGMNYFDGFTHLQYDAIQELNDFLLQDNLGHIYLSTNMRYHGKMYSFLKNDSCIASFVDSSNLGSFVGVSGDYIESDVMFKGKEAIQVNQRIINIIKYLGTNLNNIPPITHFKESKFNLLNDNNFVDKISEEEYQKFIDKKLNYSIELPLKTEPKSNLNAYFGKGKMPNRYSPRDWYEVEYIINKKTPNYDKLPKPKDIFTVVTYDRYKFKCQRQGDYGKNLRTVDDLRILGKWIKGHMEKEGALKLGEPVTEETLHKFHKTKISLTPTSTGVWLLNIV